MLNYQNSQLRHQFKACGVDYIPWSIHIFCNLKMSCGMYLVKTLKLRSSKFLKIICISIILHKLISFDAQRLPKKFQLPPLRLFVFFVNFGYVRGWTGMFSTLGRGIKLFDQSLWIKQNNFLQENWRLSTLCIFG